MCQRTICRECGKPDWKGCGAHVEQVLGEVAPADRCPRDHQPVRSGWLGRLLKR